MSRSRLSTKGQLVIPARLRKALNLRPGDQVEIELEGRAINPAGPIAARRKTQARKVRTPGSGGGRKRPGNDHRERDRAARAASMSHLLDVNFLIEIGR